jgi:hypothetical protein
VRTTLTGDDPIPICQYSYFQEELNIAAMMILMEGKNMTLRISKTLLFIIFLIAACFKSKNSSANDDPDIKKHDLTKIDLRIKLPKDSYSGKSENIDPYGAKSNSTLIVAIDENRIITEEHSGEFISLAVDVIAYQLKGDIFWTDIKSKKIGLCSCEKLMCSCAGFDGKAIYSKKDIQFYEDRLEIKTEFQAPDGNWKSLAILILE